MRNITVLGAGLVARPLVRYLLNQPEYRVKVASRTVSKAEKLISGHPQGEPQKFDITTDKDMLNKLVADADIVISLLPYVYHVTVAKYCIEHSTNMVTTSYVSDAMRALDAQSRSAGILILNELGLDPGIDHMSAMKIIHRIQRNGGQVVSFRSYCGGLPAPEANTNPFGYKISWSPRGVALAGKNDARYLEDGREVVIPGEELFANYTIIDIERLGKFEAYPNRDSIPYIDTYGIKGTSTMYRGTLRNIGWCDTWKKLVELGILDDTKKLASTVKSYRELLVELIKAPREKVRAEPELKRAVAEKLNLAEGSPIIQRLDWLGLFSDANLPPDAKTPLDCLVALMADKLQYGAQERDMIILRHEFIAVYPHEERREKIISTLIDFGIPGGDSAMARTVGLPAAIGTKLILQNKIDAVGVQIPVHSSIYKPILEELKTEGIEFIEKSVFLSR